MLYPLSAHSLLSCICGLAHRYGLSAKSRVYKLMQTKVTPYNLAVLAISQSWTSLT